MTRINLNPRALADAQLRRRHLRRCRQQRTGLQAHARAFAGGQQALGGVFLILRRGPDLQRSAWRCTARHALCVVIEAVHRGCHGKLGAIGDHQTFIARDVIGAKALIEEPTAELQRPGTWGNRRIADQHLAGLHTQAPAAIDPIPEQLTVEGQAASAVATIGVGRERQVTTLAASELALGIQGCAG